MPQWLDGACRARPARGPDGSEKRRSRREGRAACVRAAVEPDGVAEVLLCDRRRSEFIEIQCKRPVHSGLVRLRSGTQGLLERFDRVLVTGLQEQRAGEEIAAVLIALAQGTCPFERDGSLFQSIGPQMHESQKLPRIGVGW